MRAHNNGSGAALISYYVDTPKQPQLIIPNQHFKRVSSQVASEATPHI